MAEIAAIAEHVASLTASTAALRLRSDVPAPAHGENPSPFIALVEEAAAGDAAPTLAEIRTWSRAALGLEHIPAVWRALAHQPRLLAATWRKDRLVLGDGTLDGFVKGCAALAVAAFRQSDYWIAYFTQFLRCGKGLDDRTLVELAGAIMHYVSFNTIAHGMRLEAPVEGITAADVAPGGTLENLMPGARRRTSPP